MSRRGRGEDVYSFCEMPIYIKMRCCEITYFVLCSDLNNQNNLPTVFSETKMCSPSKMGMYQNHSTQKSSKLLQNLMRQSALASQWNGLTFLYFFDDEDNFPAMSVLECCRH